MQHYRTSRIQEIDVIRDWMLGFNLGNVIKYVSRAGKKKSASYEDDLYKALWYLLFEICNNTDLADDIVEQIKGYSYPAK